MFIKILFLISVPSILFIGCDIDGITETKIPEVVLEQNSVAPIKIISPVSTNRWKCGTEESIVWESPVNVKRVRIELYRKLSLQRIIENEIDNKNIYRWKIPDNLSASLNYSIKVINVENETQFGQSERFTIER
ncbi:MAG: GPI anchored serine-threonine rich family protein [Ignavibacterium sp.]|nr:GPI anchored serine-threonine rich family protein [Ignavibacterium sp.]